MILNLLNTPGAREANPIIGSKCERLLAAKLVAIVPVLVLTQPPMSLFEAYAGYVLIAVYSIVVANNLRVIWRLPPPRLP